MNANQNFKWQLTYRNDKVVEFIDEDGDREEFAWSPDGRLDLFGFYAALRREADYEAMACEDPEEK